MQFLPLTSIVKAHNASFPLGSRASQKTSVCPISNLLPEAKLHVIVGDSPALSSACGLVQIATAVERLGAVSFVWFAGHEINVGSSVSECRGKFA